MTEKDEVCITQEEYKELLGAVQGNTNAIRNVSETVDDIDEKVELIQEDSKETRKMITGNGVPEQGLLWRQSLTEKIINDHLAFHKDVKNTASDLIKPIISKLIEYGILGAIFYAIERVYH